jgi:DNA ligase (NAD+)
MDKNQVKKRIRKLEDEIKRLRFEYHVKNNPKVTDDIYESLSRELHELQNKYPEFVNENSTLNRVAGKPLPNFKKFKHEIRMTSLNDVFSKEEIFEWEKRVKKILNGKDFSYFCELKLDGLSASLIYENGIFVRGITRGDGFIGEDVTENLKMIESIPLKLNAPYYDYMEIRGEVVMFKNVWQNLNNKQEELGKPTFANTRNAAAGSLRQLDPSVVKERKLSFFAWDIAQFGINNEELRIKNHSDEHKILRDLGFLVCEYEKKAKNIEDIFRFIEDIGEKRSTLSYGTDGMVVSINELKFHDTLGIVGKAPRYMIAYKYQAERATSLVKDISVSVGRTGVLTPVAHFNPTLVAGSTVAKATLHNMDQIERLDIRIGDTIVIQKAGDVIPEVVEVLTKMRTGKEKKFKMPNVCPVCGASVERVNTRNEQSSYLKGPRISSPNTLEEVKGRGQTVSNRTLLVPSQNTIKSSVAFYCTNKHCPARSRRGLQHFVNIFEIYEIGPRILDRLQEEGLISDAADLFTLEKSDLSGLERFGEKSADNIISSIQLHKNISLWRFIYALGIIHVGEQTAQDLANHFGSLEKLQNAELIEINNIENIGPVVSESIFKFFKDKLSLDFIEKLIVNGVNIHHERAKSLKLSGNTFVLTGTLSTMSREDAKKKIIGNGGSVSSSVSTKTSYVIAGGNPGSKYNDAKKNNVKILTEDEFLKML